MGSALLTVLRHGRSANSANSKREAPISLESAAGLLAAYTIKGEAPSSGERRIREGYQKRDLEAWGEQQGLCREGGSGSNALMMGI